MTVRPDATKSNQVLPFHSFMVHVSHTNRKHDHLICPDHHRSSTQPQQCLIIFILICIHIRYKHYSVNFEIHNCSISQHSQIYMRCRNDTTIAAELRICDESTQMAMNTSSVTVTNHNVFKSVLIQHMTLFW